MELPPGLTWYGTLEIHVYILELFYWPFMLSSVDVFIGIVLIFSKWIPWLRFYILMDFLSPFEGFFFELLYFGICGFSKVMVESFQKKGSIAPSPLLVDL